MRRILDYTLNEVIGRGSEGIVYLGTNTRTNKSIAVKEIRLQSSSAEDEQLITKVTNEYQLLKLVKSSNLVKLYQLIRSDNNLFIVYKLYPTDLRSFLNRNKLIPERTIRKWTLQLLKGLSDLHFYQILHRDLKPSNILLTQDSCEGDVVITDFGVSVFSYSMVDHECIGSLEYMSPELLQGKEHSERSDVFALGMILYEMMTSEPVNKVMILNKRFNFRQDLSLEAQSFVKNCLKKNPKDRWNTHQLASCNFIKDEIMSLLNSAPEELFDIGQSIKIGMEESIVVDNFERLFRDSDIKRAEEHKETSLNVFRDTNMETAVSPAEERIDFFEKLLAFCHLVDREFLIYYVFWYLNPEMSALVQDVESGSQRASEGYRKLIRELYTTAQSLLNDPPRNMGTNENKYIYAIGLLDMVKLQIQQIKMLNSKEFLILFVNIAIQLNPNQSQIRIIARELLGKINNT